MSGVSASPSVRPSMVVIFFPCASMASTEQAYTVLPSISTVQAPHTPRSQTRFAPVKLKVSRRASRSVTRGSSCAPSFLPFTMSSTGTLPGPWTVTSSPAACTTVGPTSSGTATPMPEIFMKSRRVTPEFCSGSHASSSFMAPPSLQFASITLWRVTWHERGTQSCEDGTEHKKRRPSAEPPLTQGAFANLFLQCADVLHEVADLSIGQRALEALHFSLAVGDGPGQISVRHALNVSAA